MIDQLYVYKKGPLDHRVFTCPDLGLTVYAIGHYDPRGSFVVVNEHGVAEQYFDDLISAEDYAGYFDFGGINW